MANRRDSSYSSTPEKVLLRPWFLPKRVTFAIHGLVPPDFWNKMRNFFDDYGCMICGKESEYHSNGMCKGCYEETRRKLLRSVKRRLGHQSNRRLDLELFRQEKIAKKLLGRFCRVARPSKKHGIDVPRQSNPVYEALCARQE